MAFVDHDSEVSQLPEDLPPVEPPSAGFIIQLFVVPGLIVLAIVGVWLLFGKLAGGEQDWKSLLVELQHPNEHRRWRGALGLAQMLKADQDRAGSQEKLSRNREIAQALSSVLTAEVKRAAQSDSDLKYQAFLARTLGLFDLPEIVLPALEQAMQSGNDRDVRKNALGSIAVMADRFATRGDSLKFPGLSDSLLKESRDDDRLIRQLSAFTLGLFSNADAQSRLEQMLDDPDLDTRINAAVGLARQGNAHGAAVFEEVLKTASGPSEPASEGEYEHYLALKNCISAIERVVVALDADDRRKFAALMEPLLQPIAADYREPQIRVSARTALNALHEAR